MVLMFVTVFVLIVCWFWFLCFLCFYGPMWSDTNKW